MQIPVYQIHNVLKVHTRQLIRSKIPKSRDTANRSGMPSEGRREGLIDRITNDIIHKITQIDDRNQSQTPVTLTSTPGKHPPSFEGWKKSQFTYNVIDENNEKKKRALSLENSVFFDRTL
jgi:hypothetical protein